MDDTYAPPTVEDLEREDDEDDYDLRPSHPRQPIGGCPYCEDMGELD